MANRVVHFEIEAKDSKRASDFYSKTFGWKMDPQGSEYGNYIVVTTGDPKEPGGINGGIFEVGDKQYNAFRCIVGVDDIKKSMEDVKANGGKIINDNEKPDDIPNVGLYVRCEDTEGNKFALLQPSMNMMENK